MIPRLKPYLGLAELLAAISFSDKDDVEEFEKAFAEAMGQKHALAFPYGRTGLLLLLQALGLKEKEIICPAYTCVVVPHAIVYSGNIPVFVDCEPNGFNMDLEKAEQAITHRTAAIIATSIFGYPVDLDRLDKIRQHYSNVLIIQDCAHSFAAEWKGRPVQREGIAAIFGLNISKILTSVFGGMITTDDEELHKKLKALRDRRLQKPTWKKSFRRLLYLLAVYLTFWGPVYGMINRLERSGMLNHFVKYYDHSKINMPEDYLDVMCNLEARVGLANIRSYGKIISNRRKAAEYYFENLGNQDARLRKQKAESRCLNTETCGLKPSFILPSKVDGATYSHFVVRVSDRDAWLKWGIEEGIQLGWLVEYNIPEMIVYGGYGPASFPFAAEYARRTINLPVWGGEKIAEKVVKVIRRSGVA